MKKLLLLCIIIPSLSFGQRFELGLNMGPAFFPSANSDYRNANKPLMPAFYSSLALTMRLQTYDITLKVGGSALKISESGQGYNNLVIASDLNEFVLSGNKHVQLHKFDMYGGISLGAIVYRNPDLQTMNDLYPESIMLSSNGSGFMGGVQIGANFPISRRFDLNMEAGASYTRIYCEYDYDPWNLYVHPPNYNVTYLAMPVTVGIKYKFGVGRRYKMRHNRKQSNQN